MHLEYLTLGLYLLILPFLGLLFSKLNKNLSDYVRGGGQATWWLAGSSILMSSTSAFTFTGNASMAFLAGPTVLIIYVANVSALLICGLFLAAWFRQTRAYTTADVVRSRFGPAVEQFSAYTQVLLTPFQAAIQLWALSVFASAAFGFSVTSMIIVIGVIVVFYSTTGGKWAVLATDFVQGLILISITILVAVLAYIKIGGFGEFFSYFSKPDFAEDFKFVKEPDQFPTSRFSMKWIIVIFFITLYHQLSFISVDRFLVVKDGREAKKSAFLAAILMAVGTAIWFFPPMVARFLYGNEIMAQAVENPENTSYSFIAGKLLPNGLMGLMIAAMFAATMSAMDTGLNKQVGILARNIIPRLRAFFGRKEDMRARQELVLCKFLTVLIGVLIMFYSILFSMNKELVLFDAYLLINSIIGIPLLFPMVMGLWIKKLPKWSYFAIFGICLLPSLYSLYLSQVHGVEWTIQERSLWIFVFGILGSLLTMPFYRASPAEYKKQVKEFFTTMRTPVDFAKEIGESRNFQQLIILGRSSLGIGLAILLLLLVPNSMWGRLGILFVAGFSIVVGLLLLLAARLEPSIEKEI